MWNVMDVPATQVPFNATTVVLYVLPPVLLYLVMAVLVLTPQTRYLRAACWPVLALLAWRATFSVDLSSLNPEQKVYNGFATPMMMIGIRSLYWIFPKEPLVRQLRPANSTPSTLMDTLDLAFTFRGLGWEWSRGLHVPRETRPLDRAGFIFHVVRSMAFHLSIYSALHVAIRSFSPDPRGSIFDETLPFHLQYFRSYIISIMGFYANYAVIQATYDMITLPAILLGQDPALWPPPFDAPWRATSLSEFWARRWHQWSRHMVMVLGGYPLSLVLGRAGFVIGAFLASGVNHHVMLSSLEPTSELWRMLVGFGMMAPGVIAEPIFKRLTGKKVCGLAGWVWTMTWLLLWGSVILDGFVRAGVFRSPTWMDNVPPLRALVERLVTDFDAWLHAIAA